MRSLLLLCCLAFSVGVITAQADDRDVALPETKWEQLSERSTSALATKALAIHPTEWKHSETANFIYHFQQAFVARPVASEAEFYYRVVAEELKRDTARWERKCHIWLFETDEAWAEFQKAGALEPWTGGIHAQGELFMPRNPKVRWKGSNVAHEVTHLIVYRFFGAGIPLWLNEGLAEYSATRWYSAYWRSRGFVSRPISRSVPPTLYMPLAQFTELQVYPADPVQVPAFYAQAERLVRFLNLEEKSRFVGFVEALSKGSRFSSAVESAYGRRFFNVEALEKEFKAYASKDHPDADR